MGALLPPSHDARLLTNGSKQRRLPICRGNSLGLLHEILHAALVCSLAFGSALLASAGCGGYVRPHDVVLSFLVIGLATGLQYANSLGAAGSLLMHPETGKAARGSEQLSFTAFVLRSSCYDVISFTGVLVYALLVSSVDGQNAIAAAVVFVLTMCLAIIVRLAAPLLPTPFARHARECVVTQVLLNMLTALTIYTWTLQQGERAVLGVRRGAQLLNEFEARMSSKASARAGRREGGRVSGGWASDAVRNRRADWFAKWQHVVNKAPTDEGADRTVAALQLR